jgi:hypothetical protein
MTRSTVILLAFPILITVGFGALDHTSAADLEPVPTADADLSPPDKDVYSSPRNPHASTTMHVVSRDEKATTRFMWLGIDKETVIELSRDIKDVLIGSKGAGGNSGASSTSSAGASGSGAGVGGAGAGVVAGGTSQPTDTEIVKVVPLSKRRVSILGVSRGHTNVFFYDNNGREIGALDIAVTTWSKTPTLDLFGTPVTTMRFMGVRNGIIQGDYITCTNIDCRRLPESRDDTDTALQTSRGSYGNSTTIYNSR